MSPGHAIRNALAENVGGAGKLAKNSQKFSLEDTPDLSGKVAVITGGSEGIGYGIAHTLLAHNISHLHMLSPSGEVADSALDDIKATLGDEYVKCVTWHQVDLTDWKTVQEVAKKISNSTDRLDILVNNSARGIMTFQIAENTGIDRHMSINHFGHVVLTTSLLPLLKKTAEQGHTVRITNQASNAHQSAPKDTKFASIDELNHDYGAMPQYGRSKLANILYSRYLARHLTSSYPKILVNATHPGFVETAQSTRDIKEPYPIAGYLVSGLMAPVKKDQWEGAVPTLYATTVTEKSGEWVCPPAIPEDGTELAQSEELGESLMKLTREVLCQKLGVSEWEDH